MLRARQSRPRSVAGVAAQHVHVVVCRIRKDACQADEEAGRVGREVAEEREQVQQPRRERHGRLFCLVNLRKGDPGMKVDRSVYYVI